MNHSEDKGRKALFQIQPMYASRDEWEALAVREDLAYEILELAMPPALNDPERYRNCEEWYLKSDRVSSVHGSFIDVNPGSGDLKQQALSRERCMESCLMARRLGAKNVIFHSSCFPFLRGGYLDFWAGSCAEFYDKLTEDVDLNLYIENSPDVDPMPIKELMSRITDRRVRVCLDIGHVNYSLASLEQWFEELHDWIAYLHLSDNSGMYDSHLALGEGTVDWEKADRLWRDLDTPMPITIETSSVGLAEQSIVFLREHNYFQLYTNPAG